MRVIKTDSKRELCTVPEETPIWARGPLSQHRLATTKLGCSRALTRNLSEETTPSRLATPALKPSVKNETGMRARVSLALRAESLGFGSAEGMKPKALSQVVLRAEQSVEERDAQNKKQEVRRAKQPPEDRDAANNARRANEQVTIIVPWHCAPCTPVRVVFGVFPTNPY